MSDTLPTCPNVVRSDEGTQYCALAESSVAALRKERDEALRLMNKSDREAREYMAGTAAATARAEAAERELRNKHDVAQEFLKRAEAAESLASEVRNRLTAICTSDNETKDQFIERVKRVLVGIPADIGAELTKKLARLEELESYTAHFDAEGFATYNANLAELSRLREVERLAHPDTVRLDWLERNPQAQDNVMRSMLPLREAIDAARKQGGAK